MKTKYNDCYELDNSKSYFSVDLQRNIKFVDKLYVKCDSEINETTHYGKLIRHDATYDDIITNNEIEFCDDDVISQYDLYKVPIYFMDFEFKK